MTEPFNVLRSYHDLESRIKELEDLVLSRVTGNRQEAPVPVPASQSNLVDFTRYQVTAIHRDSNEVVLRTLGFREVSPHLQVRQGVYMAKFPAGADAWPTPKAPAAPPKDFKCSLAKETRVKFEQQGEFEKDEFFFSQELVSQYGGDYIDDDATIFKISAKDLYVLLKVIGYGQDPSALDELRTLLDAAEEALVSAQKMIDVALPKFNWGASFLNAEAIQLLNETPREVTEALRRIGELKVEQSRVQN